MDTEKTYRIAVLAKKLGLNRTTIIAAIARGELPSHPTACGLPLVTRAEVQRWAKVQRTRGPKPTAETE